MVQQHEKPTLEVAANQLIVLGAGALVDDDRNTGHLTDASVARADRAAEHYYQNLYRFSASEAIIVCSGVSAVIAEEDVSETLSEGWLMYKYLVDHHEIPFDKVKVEPGAVTTMTNIADSLGMTEGSTQYINPNEISEDNPLGLVTHQDHMVRALFLAAKLGVDPNAVRPVAVPEDYAPKREAVSRFLYKLLLSQAATPEDAIEIEREIIQPLTRAAIPTYLVLKHGCQFVKSYTRLALDTIF